MFEWLRRKRFGESDFVRPAEGPGTRNFCVTITTSEFGRLQARAAKHGANVAELTRALIRRELKELI